MSVNKVILTKWYLDEKKSLTDISKLCGLSISTVRKRIIDYNIPLRTRSEGIRNARHKLVTKKDILNYIHTFTASYKFLLGKNSFLNASYYISPNIGAIIHFSISDTNNTILEVADLQILNFVKRKQLTATETSKLLAEEKVKLYEEKEFYIIKSNLFKDWTKRQAIVDAKEEIELIIKNMSKR